MLKTNKAVTLYAIFRKDVTITFNKNGALTQTNAQNKAVEDNTVTRACTMWNLDKNCEVTSPTIVPKTGFTVIGYNSNSNGETSEWTHNTAKPVTDNMAYYAITKKDKIIYTKSLKIGEGVSQIGGENASCTIKEVYNGKEQDKNCDITLPSITLKNG